jgi:UDP-N-acetyl-D-galactosamine dehydrogenase
MSSTTISHSIVNFPPLETCTVAVIGLGYVGLPLAVEFAKPQACARTGAQLRRRVIGFDINQQRLSELRTGHVRTNEIAAEDCTRLRYWSSPRILLIWRKRMFCGNGAHAYRQR